MSRPDDLILTAWRLPKTAHFAIVLAAYDGTVVF